MPEKTPTKTTANCRTDPLFFFLFFSVLTGVVTSLVREKKINSENTVEHLWDFWNNCQERNWILGLFAARPNSWTPGVRSSGKRRQSWNRVLFGEQINDLHDLKPPIFISAPIHLTELSDYCSPVVCQNEVTGKTQWDQSAITTLPTPPTDETE